MMASASSSSSPPNNMIMVPQMKYDVFLSFRGEDTRDGFTSHLHAALRREHIKTFSDDQLIRGDEISPSLLNAIEISKISVVIFSEKYAVSTWCLEELVEILECKNKQGQIVIPVFYGVAPSDVRYQTGIFGNFFSKLEERFQGRSDKLQKWRTALTEAANLSGFDSSVTRRESNLVEEITNSILKRLGDMFATDDNGLVGVESRIREIESLLDIGSMDVFCLGIWGIGGIGKTTIADAVFKEISGNFESSCFIRNIREAEEKGSLHQLQQYLFSTILGDANVNINFQLEGIKRKKILIVFDDVTKLKQIESLIERLDRFAPGSRIIITSRDKQVLKNCGVSKPYKMEELVDSDAFKLFSRHAFKQYHLNESYIGLSKKVIEYAHGVPLALKVLGRFLFEKKENFWKNTISKLKKIPIGKIQEVLKLSYDCLDDNQKKIFLDIVFFFVGEHRDSAIKFFFYDYSSSPEIDMEVLVDKCLITIIENTIFVHDLLQDMATKIVRQESINDPKKRSRLCNSEDICKVLKENKETEAIEGISLNMNLIEKIHLNPYTFERMPHLRILKFYNLFTQENNCKVSCIKGWVFTQVRYFQWDGYPLKSLPSRFKPENLVSLKMCDSNIKQLWDGVQNFVNLKEIDLSGSKQLMKLPDLSRAINLETLKLVSCTSLKSLPTSIHAKSLKKLYLQGCYNLKSFPEISSCDIEVLTIRETAIKELPSSIRCLSRLPTLDLHDCKMLESLPSSFCELKSLQTLCLGGCSNLQRLPDEFGNLESLKQLSASETAIKELPSSIGCLSRLHTLNLYNCKKLESLPSSLCKLKSLECLGLGGCSNLQRLPDELENLESLLELHADEIAIKELPSSIGCLRRLRTLGLGYCQKLESLPSSLCELTSLEKLNLNGCCNLQRLPDELGNLESLFELHTSETAIKELPSSIGCLSRLHTLNLYNCKMLESLPSSLCVLTSLEKLELNGCCNLQRLPDQLGNLESFFMLHADETVIKELPSSMGRLSRLLTLDLHDCKMLESLPSSFCELKSLQTLYLGGCSNLQRLPDEFGNLESLKQLSASETAIKELPSSIGCLSRLHTLNLYNCKKLESLPSSLCKLKSLECLGLGGCSNLQRLPDELENLESLLELHADEIAIKELPSSIGCLWRLRTLGLGYCEMLESLPSSLCELTSLKRLYFNGCCNLQRLPDELGNLKSLEILSVSETAIKELPSSIGCLSKLLYLYLCDCKILESLPSSLCNLKSLGTLMVNGCSKLQRLPDELGNLESLTTLYAEGTAIREIPQKHHTPF